MPVEFFNVTSCPNEANSWLEAGIKLNCPNDTEKRILYQCAPNKDLSSLVEFCFKGNIGRYEKGVCLHAQPNGHLGLINCSHFEYGCPENTYINSDIYKYQACLQINPKEHCFLADPSCPNITRTSPSSEQRDLDAWKIALGITCIVVCIFILLGILFFWRRKSKTGNLNPQQVRYIRQEAKGHVNFSEDEQKCILFTLLRYDKNGMSLQDGDWLSRLNRIRKEIYDLGSVSLDDVVELTNDKFFLSTSGLEIQNTKQGLYLKFMSDADIKRAMFLFLEASEAIFENSSYFVRMVNKCFLNICKSQIRGFVQEREIYLQKNMYPALVYRFQIDILKHQMIGDKEMQKTMSWILHIHHQNLNTSSAMNIYTCLTAELTHSYQKHEFVKWTESFWRDNKRKYFELMPQCARSTIGLYNHNDLVVFHHHVYYREDSFDIIEDKSCLYILLLSEKFSIEVEKYDKEIDRYIIDGFTQKDCNKVYFVSEEIRHKVMYSFVVNCLLTDIDMEFFIQVASLDCLLEYSRPWRYERQENERCIFIPERMEDLYIQTLGLNIIKHEIFNHTDNLQKTMRNVSNLLNVPCDLLRQPKSVRLAFLDKVETDIVTTGTEDMCDLPSLKYIYSAFLFQSTEGDLEGMDDEYVWSILLTILMSSGYKMKIPTDTDWYDPIFEIREKFLGLKEKNCKQQKEALKESIKKENLFEHVDGYLEFISPVVKENVMSRFIKNYLKSDEVLAEYIKTTAEDSLKEYCRLWGYKREEGEKCIFIPESLTNMFIERLSHDAITHVMVEKRADSDGVERYETYRNKVSELLNIPREILNWDKDAKDRYVKYNKKELCSVFRARGMLVGCAGAGKTTLLRRLQGKKYNDFKDVQSTVGLEVHDDLFLVLENEQKLIGESYNADFAEYYSEENSKFPKKTLSMTDFGGQCVYYACHQIYLTRRAFYILVVDMSRDFKAVVSTSECDQKRTYFEDWTYGEYFVFWLKSIDTYCNTNTPVIIVGTHCEKRKQDSKDIYKTLYELLPKNLELHKHMHIENCFPIGFENNDETEGSSISKIEKSIVQTILSQKHWGEEIPLSWYKFEAFLSKEKEENKILSPQELFKRFQSNVENYISPNIDEMEQVDILQFFHEIGRILFFQEDNLRDYVILDVQWFVDAFKHVITDCNHMPVVNRPREWDEFNSTGVLHHTVLEEIWRYADCRGILKYKDVILPYMQRLGLLVIGEESHLIPSVTKREYKEEMSMLSTTDQKTLILYFSFDFLPLFVYHRLVVSCFSFKDWLPLQDGYKCIYKNVSEFKYEHHYIVLGVFKEDIYLQIYRPNMQNAVLNKNVTLKVRQTVEDELEKLSNSYHRKIKFETGFYCMTKENSDRCFIPESEMRILTSEICPHHESRPNHTIISKEYMWPWDKTVQKPAP